MKYHPVLPEHNDNVSHQRPVREFFILLFGLAMLTFVVFWLLGLLVDVAVDHLPPEAEIALFADIDFLGDEQQVTPDRAVRVQQLLDALRPCIGVAHPVKVRFIQSDHANAFALPGGTVAVTSTLLQNVMSENGLSFVLAHELGHIKHRDHLRALGRGIVLAVLSVAFTGSNSDLSHFLAPTMELGQAQYSQSRESQADEAALSALQCYYGHVGGATEFFQTLKHGTQDLGVFHYFSTHPEVQARIDRLGARVNALSYAVDETQPLAL